MELAAQVDATILGFFQQRLSWFEKYHFYWKANESSAMSAIESTNESPTTYRVVESWNIMFDWRLKEGQEVEAQLHRGSLLIMIDHNT